MRPDHRRVDAAASPAAPGHAAASPQGQLARLLDRREPSERVSCRRKSRGLLWNSPTSTDPPPDKDPPLPPPRPVDRADKPGLPAPPNRLSRPAIPTAASARGT